MKMHPEGIAMRIGLKSVIAATLLGVVGTSVCAQTNTTAPGKTPEPNCSLDTPYKPQYFIGISGGGEMYTYEYASPCIPAAVVETAHEIGMARRVPLENSFVPLDIKTVITAQYRATGTYTPPGAKAPLNLTKSRMQISYVAPAFRFDYEANGVRHIDVWSYKHAWNETAPGVGATPAMNTLDQRIPLIWLTPQGAIWTAIYAERKTKVSTVDGKTVFSAPFDQLGIVSTTTIGKNKLPEKTVLRYKGRVYEATFADYVDEEPAYKSKFPTKMVWKLDGKEIGNFSITDFHGDSYATFNVPANVNTAASAPIVAFYDPPDVGFIKSLPKSTLPTPRLANGKPDLSGYWTRHEGLVDPDFGTTLFGPVVSAAIRGARLEKTTSAALDRHGADHGTSARCRPNKPHYKPEYWDKVQSMDMGKASGDPYWSGTIMGLPRQGPPAAIVQTPTEIALYVWWWDAVRIIPTDGRARNPDDLEENTYAGIGLGHWEGDTLVIESVGFNDKQWLAYPGYFHTDKMKVTERLHRDGEYLFYDVTIDDPDVLQEPWVMETLVRHLNTNPSDRPSEWKPWSNTNPANGETHVRG
jgi:hypothetical protein